MWESPLVTGEVNRIRTVDAQITHKIPKISATIKIGGSDIFNKTYIQYAGGPTLGALVYSAISFDGLFK